jgi:hypothetical protein
MSRPRHWVISAGGSGIRTSFVKQFDAAGPLSCMLCSTEIVSWPIARGRCRRLAGISVSHGDTGHFANRPPKSNI